MRVLLDNNIKYKGVRNRRDNVLSTSPILTAAVGKKEACVMEFMSRGFGLSDKSSHGENLLMLAAANGLVNIVKECLERFEEVKSPETDNEGRTAIMHACINKQYVSEGTSLLWTVFIRTCEQSVKTWFHSIDALCKGRFSGGHKNID